MFIYGLLNGEHDPIAKGKEGEYLVARILLSKFNTEPHILLNNVVLLDSKSFAHQIDHIEIREKGIFVIETKNMEGSIRGKAEDDKWIVTSPLQTYKIYNPLKQNETHIKVLKSLLKKHIKRDIPIYSVVVFVSNNAKFLGIENVINATHLRKYLNDLTLKKTFTMDEMKKIEEVIINNDYRDKVSVTIQNRNALKSN